MLFFKENFCIFLFREPGTEKHPKQRFNKRKSLTPHELSSHTEKNIKIERVDGENYAHVASAENLLRGEHEKSLVGEESVRGEGQSVSPLKDGHNTPVESDTEDEEFTSKDKLCGRYRSVS